MRRTPLLRLFWLGAAAVLTAAALVALVAVLGGSFGKTDARILGVLDTALLAGGVATAGASLRETRLAPALGLANEPGRPTFSSSLRSSSAPARALARRSQLVLFGLTAAFSVLGGLVVVGAIWSEHAGSAMRRGRPPVGSSRHWGTC